MHMQDKEIYSLLIPYVTGRVEATAKGSDGVEVIEYEFFHSIKIVREIGIESCLAI